MDKAELGELDPKIIQLVTQRVGKFRGWYGINEEDVEDISQDILWGLNRKLAQIRQRHPVENPKYLALSFAKKRMIDVLRARLSYKGTMLRRTRELVDTFFDQDRLPGDTTDRVRDPKRLGDMTQAELAVQVAEVIQGLPKELQELCALLRHHTKSRAARMLGISRSMVDRMVEKLRAAFIAAGFTEFATRMGAVPDDLDDESDADLDGEAGTVLEPMLQPKAGAKTDSTPRSQEQAPNDRHAKIIHLNRPFNPPVQDVGAGD